MILSSCLCLLYVCDLSMLINSSSFFRSSAVKPLQIIRYNYKLDSDVIESCNRSKCEMISKLFISSHVVTIFTMYTCVTIVITHKLFTFLFVFVNPNYFFYQLNAIVLYCVLLVGHLPRSVSNYDLSLIF